MFRRLLRRLQPSGTDLNPGLQDTPSQPVNLVDDEPQAMPPPPLLGITTTPEVLPWTIARLERIVRRANAQPRDVQLMLEARHARHVLSRFWLSAPLDLLEDLYAGPIGQVYRLLLLGVLPSQPLAADEEAWRVALAERLVARFDAAERLNLLLAVMPYCRRGRMRLVNPGESLPSWLLTDYASCFDADLAEQLDRPIALLEQAGARPSRLSDLEEAEPTPAADPAPAIDLPEKPLLSEIRGQQGYAMFGDPAYVDRMNGLINLFSIDPDDAAVRAELGHLRRLIGQIWLDVAPNNLEALYQTSLGQVYRSLLASNFGALPVEGEDLDFRNDLTNLATNMNHPAGCQALLAVMPFYPQGSMELGDGRSLLPGWLQREFSLLAGS
jgi:hypothetical protein